MHNKIQRFNTQDDSDEKEKVEVEYLRDRRGNYVLTTILGPKEKVLNKLKHLEGYYKSENKTIRVEQPFKHLGENVWIVKIESR